MAELGVFGVGVAAANPELRTVGKNGSQVCTVSLAFNRSYKDKDDNWQKETTYMRAQVWGKRATRMAELVKTGQPLYVTGYLTQDNWEKDGQKRVSYTITLRDFQLCEKNGKKKSDKQPEEQNTAPVTSSAPADTSDDDEIPF
jgi:single-strand DNA-binding protein